MNTCFFQNIASKNKIAHKGSFKNRIARDSYTTHQTGKALNTKSALFYNSPCTRFAKGAPALHTNRAATSRTNRAPTSRTNRAPVLCKSRARHAPFAHKNLIPATRFIPRDTSFRSPLRTSSFLSRASLLFVPLYHTTRIRKLFAAAFALFAATLPCTAQTVTLTSRALSSEDGYLQTAAYLSTPLVQARAAYSFKPQKKLYNAAVCIMPFAFTAKPKLLSIYWGTISASGVFSRAKTPAISLPDPLANPSVPTQGLKFSMPSISTSAKTARALGVKLQLSSFNVGAFVQLPPHTTDTTTADAANAPTAPSAATFFAPLLPPLPAQTAGAPNPIEKCLFGIEFNPKANKSGVLFKSSLYAGRHIVRIKQTAAEKKKNLPQESHALNFGMFESSLSGRNGKLFLSTDISEYPNGYFSTWARLQGGYKNRFATINAGIFRSTLYHWALSGSQQNKTLSAYINPQLRLISFGRVPQSVHIGARIAAERTYSTAKVPVKSVRSSGTAELLYTVGFFSLNPQISLEKALHNTKHFAKIDEKTQIKSSVALTASPTVFGQTHRYSGSYSYSFYPKDEAKTRDITAKVSGTVPVGNLVSIKGEHSVTLKTDVGDKKNPIPSDEQVFKPYSYSSKLRVQITPVTKSVKTVFSLEERFKQNVQKDENPTIVFYCVCTLYIKP